VGVEVFAGNTQDASTVPEKIVQLQRQHGLKEIIFVGDRDMITKAVAQKLKGTEGLHTISALTHRQIVELLERKVITAEFFDEKQIVEVFDPQDPKRRYCLCRNTQKGETSSNNPAGTDIGSNVDSAVRRDRTPFSHQSFLCLCWYVLEIYDHILVALLSTADKRISNSLQRLE
jgi:hypothetical protein